MRNLFCFLLFSFLLLLLFLLFLLFKLESVRVYCHFDFRIVVQQSWLHEVSKSKVALAVFCISFTAFTGQSPRRFSRIVPVHAMFFSVIRLDILLLISEVRVTPLSLVLCQCGSLFWRWCSTGSRKLSFSLGQQWFGCRRNGRCVCKMSEDPSETSFSLLSASVVTAADTSGAVQGILWRENGDGFCQ